MSLKATEVVLIAAYVAYSALWAYIWIIRFSFLFIINYTVFYYIIMSVFAGAGAFPLYRIAERKVGRLAALCISLSYLAYFPLAAADWSGADLAFPTLFLMAYYLYAESKNGSAAMIFSLGSVLGPLPSLFSFVFSAHLLPKDRSYYITVAVSSASLAAYAVLNQFPRVAFSPGMVFGGTFALLIVLLPLLFAPLISFWALALIPLALLAVLSPGYQYPGVLLSGAIAPFLPFIFLGMVEGVQRLAGVDRKALKVFSVILLINASLFAAVYQPVSPLNQYTTLDFGFANVIKNYDQMRAVYGNISNMLKLVQPGSTVLVQESIMPPGNVKLYTLSQVNPKASFQYVLAGPNSSYFVPQGPSGITMSSLAEKLYSSNYGVLAEADDMVLMERNYTGPVVYYRPTSVTWTADKILPLGKTVLYDDELIVLNPKQVQAWYIPDNFLPVGNYTLIAYMKQSTPSSSNLMSIAIFSDNMTHLLSFHYVSSSMVNESWTRVEYTFSVPRLYSNVEIFSYIYSWQGSLYLSNVSVVGKAF